jgi:hypothetical protein
MEHQYPVAITGDENMLAELMLPDQAHARNQDWTMFFLHKDTSPEDEDDERKAKARRKARRQRRRDKEAGLVPEGETESSDDEPDGGEGPPLIYVLNLVNTKHDKTVKRGAIVKAMAICTRHPFLHIYKVRGHAARCLIVICWALQTNINCSLTAATTAGIGGVL